MKTEFRKITKEELLEQELPFEMWSESGKAKLNIISIKGNSVAYEKFDVNGIFTGYDYWCVAGVINYWCASMPAIEPEKKEITFGRLDDLLEKHGYPKVSPSCDSQSDLFLKSVYAILDELGIK